MFRDRFSLFIFIRIILLLITCMLFAFLFARTEFLFSQIIIFTLIILQVAELIRFTGRTSRDLARFLFAIRHGDLNVNFNEDSLTPYFRDLAGSFRELILAFRNTKIEKEAQYQLLQSVLDCIGFGIIVYNTNGEIILMNKSASDLLGIPRISDWNHIRKTNPKFTVEADNLGKEGKKLVEIGQGKNLLQLSVNINILKILDREWRILTFHDIRDEIEQKEIEAWYKLIRVMTHEIMNSVTPLSSLGDTMLTILEVQDGKAKPLHQISEGNIDDLRTSVKTIQSRSRGILQFVDDYRKLTNIPMPEFSVIPVKKIVEPVTTLLRPELDKRKIAIQFRYKSGAETIRADKKLMEQVLINLITNSMYALEGTDSPGIKISVTGIRGRTLISVSDNGRGIEAGKMDKIFLPFYSTREGGSGIGLSLSRQLIHMHQGRIRAVSDPGKFTEFIIDLPGS